MPLHRRPVPSARLLTRGASRALLAALLLAAAVALPVGSASATTPSCSSAGITVTSLGGTNFYIDGSNPVVFRSGYTGYRVTDATGTALGDVWAQLSGFTGGALGLAATQPAAQRVGDLAAGGSAARFWYLTATGQSTAAQNHTVTLYTHNPALPNAAVLCSTTGGFASVQGTISANANTVDTVSVSGGKPTLGSRFTVTVVGHTGTIGAGLAADPGAFWMTPSVFDDWPAGSFRLLTTNLNVSPNGTAAAQNYVDTLQVPNMSGPDRPYTASYTFEAVGPSPAAATVQPVQEIASGSQMKHTSSYPASLPAIPSPDNDLSLDVAPGDAQLPLGGGTTTLTGTAHGTAGAELDSLSVTLPSGASVVAGSATWGGTTLPDPVLSGGEEVFSGPFTVGAGPLAVKIAFDGHTTGDRAVSLAGSIGTTTIGGAVGSTSPATTTVNVDTAPTAADTSRTIPPDTSVSVNVASLMADADGDPLSVSVGQPEHGTFTVSGTTMTYTPASGYLGDDVVPWTVDDGRGGHAGANVYVTMSTTATVPVPPAAQSISFDQPGDLLVGGHESLVASASSGLTVDLRSTTTAVCTVSGDVVTAVAAGTCALEATQSGDDTHAQADPVTRQLAVSSPAPQSIAFPQPGDLVVGDHATLGATASSGLAVTYSSETSSTCTVAADVVTAVAPGACVLDADQSGSDAVAAAEPVSRTLAVTAPASVPAAQSVDFPQPGDLVVGSQETLAASATSALPVAYSSLTTDVCTVAGAVVSAVAAGPCTIEADQAGGSGYAAADPVSRTFTVTAPVTPPVPPAPATQTIAFDAPAMLLGTAPTTLGATASSGLPVVLAVVGGPCSVVGTTLAPSLPGSCTLEASQAGDATHAAATAVRRTVAFVVPADDRAATAAATAVTVDVLANDPAGVMLASVATPSHGSASIVGGRVRYVPDPTFHGTDSVSYTVARDGRTADATLTVSVANPRPVVRGGSVGQVAGSTVRTTVWTAVAGVPAPRVAAVSDDAGVTATMDGGTLVLQAAPGSSGDVRVTVTATDDQGATATATVRDRVAPPAPATATRRLSASGTALSWTAAPTRGAAYDVLVDGVVVCHTTHTACAIGDVLGPQRAVRVRTDGSDGTTSARTPAPLSGHGQVLVTTVYFASGSAALTADDRRILDAAIRVVQRAGFALANLDGYTDADGGLAFNLALSHRRTRAVAAYLRDQGGLGNVQSWHGETDPVASNADARGKARNRRVEVLVRY